MDFLEMDGDTPVVEIVDYKTGGVKDKADLKKDLQLPLYALFAQRALGVKVGKAKYIFIEHNKEIEVDISQERQAQAEETVLRVVGEIIKGNFDANPGFLCQFCDYKDICEDAIL
jgi:CRISPR/Cas system-associated exonuclease Cas4 (RecB family)